MYHAIHFYCFSRPGPIQYPSSTDVGYGIVCHSLYLDRSAQNCLTVCTARFLSGSVLWFSMVGMLFNSHDTIGGNNHDPVP